MPSTLRRLLLASAVVLTVLAVPATAAAQQDPVSERAVEDTSVIEYVSDAYGWIAFFGGLAALIMLIYAGYRYMTSYGDPEKISDAKDIIEKSLIGLGLLILAALILNTINPRTVEDTCRPGEAGCGDIDFSQPDGGAGARGDQEEDG